MSSHSSLVPGDAKPFSPVTDSSTSPRNSEEVPIRVHDDSQRDVTGFPQELRSSIRILVVDDDRTLREGCASVLQVEGYNLTVCGRGDEAIDVVRRAQFDVVLVDLYMTPVAGMEILKAVLSVRPETIVVMMTG